MPVLFIYQNLSQRITCNTVKGVLYSMLGPDLVGLTVAVYYTDFWSNWTYRAL